MASPGLLDWANSIRLQISNDSAKHIFQEQIQQLGFNFLEARLDTVMAGPKKEYVTPAVHGEYDNILTPLEVTF